MKHNIKEYDEYLTSKFLIEEKLSLYDEIFDLVQKYNFIDSDFPDHNVNLLMQRFLSSLNLSREDFYFYVLILDNKKMILTKKIPHYVKIEKYDISIVRNLKKYFKMEIITI
jgi:hypothetical protein